MQDTRRHEVLAGRAVLPLVGAADDGRGRESRIDELAAEDRLRAVADAPQTVENASCWSCAPAP